jgi:hypothetical protein
MQAQALQALEAAIFPIFDANPVLMGSAAVPALYALAAQKGMATADVDQIRADYVAQHNAMAALTAALTAATTPAPAAKTDLQARIAADTTGLLQDELAIDVNGRIRHALEADPTGNTQAALIGSLLDSTTLLRDVIMRQDSGDFARMLAKDPLGTQPESYGAIVGAGLEPVQMVSVGKLHEAAQRCGLTLALPA